MTLTRVGFIPLPPGKQPGFDHADVYRAQPSRARLYVAHTGADRIEVIDCVSNIYLHSLPQVPGVAGVLINREQDFLFSSDRGCARASIYRDDHRLETVQTVSTESGAHTIGWNPDTCTLYAFLPQSGGAAVFVEQ